MVNSAPDMSKITTLADGLSGAVHSVDLRKLNSNLHRIQTQMKALEQGLKRDPGIDTLLLKKSLASLKRHSDALHSYADTMKALSKEVFKLNLLLKQNGAHGPQNPMKRQSGPQVKGHPTVVQVATGATVLTTMGNGSETFTTPANTTLMPNTHTGARKNKSSIYMTRTLGGENEGTEQSRKVREDECSGTLLAIDPPVSHGTYRKVVGAWMKDSLSQEEKIYITENLFGSSLLEFRNLEHLKQGRRSHSYALPCSWIGAGHLVYNGSFYFNEAFTRTIQRFDIRQRSVAAWSTLDDLVTQPTAPLVWRGYSDVTFAADHGGLWIIYHSNDFAYQNEESVVLAKLDPEELLIRKESSWRTRLHRGSYGLYFLICGVLYTVNAQDGNDELVSYAFDTHTASHTNPGLLFPGEISLLTHLTYDPMAELLCAWANGTLVTYSLHLSF
ncbi:olfactomedin-like protein 2A [Lissotriton helveticus]